MSKLAVFGENPVRETPFPHQNTFDQSEFDAVYRVLKSGNLSLYRGNWLPEFYGGPEIQALEEEWRAKFNVKHAIPVNSCTSGLQVACGAIGLTPLSEVIVTPWSMSCSATAPLVWNAIPVFADIEPDCYCLDPDSIIKNITDRTKAILVVDLFGQSHNIKLIKKIAKKYNLKVIVDSAQAIFSKVYIDKNYSNRSTEFKYSGTFGDIGVYSFNQGKHITSGEGGMIVTDDDELALKCRMIMNHAESVQRHIPDDINPGLENMLGFNMRMTEITAAIVRCQLAKSDELVFNRLRNVNYLIDKLSTIPSIYVPKVRQDYTHSYYVAGFQFDEKEIGVNRNKFIEAVKAELVGTEGREKEGVPIGCGYTMPLYMIPMFQQGIVYAGTGFPIGDPEYRKTVKYDEGICPTCEYLWKNKLFVIHRYFGPNSTKKDMNDVYNAFEKVYENRGELI